MADNSAGCAVPIGRGLDYFGSELPAGWLWADGSAVSRTTYARLFAVIGVVFGAGDGSTTFNLPDERGRLTRDNIAHGHIIYAGGLTHG